MNTNCLTGSVQPYYAEHLLKEEEQHQSKSGRVRLGSLGRFPVQTVTELSTKYYTIVQIEPEDTTPLNCFKTSVSGTATISLIKKTEQHAPSTITRHQGHVSIQIDEDDRAALGTTSKLPAIIGTTKHIASAAPSLGSLSSLAIIAATYGLAPTGASLFSILVCLLSIGSTAKSFHSDYKSGFHDFKDMSNYQISQLLAQSSLDIFALSQSSWGVVHSALGHFKDNQFIAGGLTKTAFDGDWKDYGHALTGVFCGLLNALGTQCVTRNSDAIHSKINQVLPDNLIISKDTLQSITSLAANASTLGYPLYDCKHATQASSYSNHYKEFYEPMNASKNIVEAFLNSTTKLEKPQLTGQQPEQTHKYGVVTNLITALAIMVKTADFFRR